MAIFFGGLIADQTTNRRHEVPQRVFGIDARFDRPAGQRNVILRNRKFFACGHTYHQFDQIETGDILRYRMLDLQTRVHFQKEEVPVLVDNEFDRSGGAIIDRFRQGDRLCAHFRAQFIRHKR